jgi:GNAT superfamily N-acetyltransferase
LEIKELTPKLQEDFLHFFDHEAFADNPKWAGCYCMYYYFAGPKEEWRVQNGPVNRKDITKLIETGRAQGFLAYQDSKPVGWCNAAPRKMLPTLERYQSLRVEDPEKVGSIVCFVVSKNHRGQGIAKQMLDAASDKFRKQGLSFAEAYPASEAKSEADNYPGPLSMYLANGFSIYRQNESATIVRKALQSSVR